MITPVGGQVVDWRIWNKEGKNWSDIGYINKSFKEKNNGGRLWQR